MGKVLRLPARGRLLVCTDLQGNLRDFRAMASQFRRALAEEPRTHLIFAGDLIHGPMLAPDAWDPWLGEYYVDDSITLFYELLELMEAHPGQVHALLGNHEHGHAGGFRTAKFYPDEVAALEARMTRDLVARFRAFCSGLPLVAIAPSGVVVTHAAPAARLDSPEDIEATSYAVDQEMVPSLAAILSMPVLGPLLWARSCPGEVARRFLRALLGRADGLAVYGHDVAAEGWAIAGDGEQVCVSTSFGVFDCHKRFLDLDLGLTWNSALALRDGVELRRLYPLAAPRQAWFDEAAWQA